MYRILIADDEDIIRDGIKHLLPYEELGFSIAAEAANGDAALEKILSEQPDVVLLDIRMPGLSGLETLRIARERGFRGVVVIVSSYTDFRYAQEAMRYGAQYYVIKPIDDDELKDVLLTLRQRFDDELSRRSFTEFYRRKARSAVIADLLGGTAVPAPSELVELQLISDRYCVVLLQSAAGIAPVLQSLSGANHYEYDHIRLSGQDVLFLRGESTIARVQDVAGFLARTAHGKTEDAIFFAFGPVVNRAQDISRSYQTACSLLQRRFFCRADRYILDDTQLPAQEEGDALDSEALQKYAAAILDGITSFHRRVIEQALHDLETQLCRTSASIASVRLFLTDLYLQIKMQVRHLYIGTDIPFLSNTEIISTVANASCLYEILDFFRTRFDIFMECTGISTRDSVLGDILHYIHCNYAGNITLENIAPLFGYNRSYLGKIFTKKMGQNFNSYVDMVRIERSKELLLQDDARVYAIAEHIGYKNVDYFHIKFRKYVGMSPAEYRKKYKGTSCSADRQNTDKGALVP